LNPGPKSLWGFSGQISSEFGAGPNPFENLWLEMQAGEFVQYSVYDVRKCCDVTFSLRGLETGKIRISSGLLSEEYAVDKTDHTVSLKTITLPAGDAFRVRVEVLEGIVQFDRVFFDGE